MYFCIAEWSTPAQVLATGLGDHVHGPQQQIGTTPHGLRIPTGHVVL